MINVEGPQLDYSRLCLAVDSMLQLSMDWSKNIADFHRIFGRYMRRVRRLPRVEIPRGSAIPASTCIQGSRISFSTPGKKQPVFYSPTNGHKA